MTMDVKTSPKVHAAAGAIDHAVQSVRRGSPEARERLESALRAVVALYGERLAAEGVERNVCAALRLVATSGGAMHPVILDWVLGYLALARSQLH